MTLTKSLFLMRRSMQEGYKTVLESLDLSRKVLNSKSLYLAKMPLKNSRTRRYSLNAWLQTTQPKFSVTFMVSLDKRLSLETLYT